MTNNLRDEIARRQAICTAATQGPCEAGTDGHGNVHIASLSRVYAYVPGATQAEAFADATLYAHARTGYPEVLAALADAVAFIAPYAEATHTAMGKEAARVLAQIAGRLGGTKE